MDGTEVKIPRWDMAKPMVTINFDGELSVLQILGREQSPVWKIGFQGSVYDFKIYSTQAHQLLPVMPLPKTVRFHLFNFPNFLILLGL